MGTVTCISGIDTDIGKTVATGLLARSLSGQGVSVITQKLVQTGGQGIAEDILRHRQLMGMDLLPEDREGLTCPYVFAKACSPHLAAELEGKRIDPQHIEQATDTLAKRFDHVLLEGAGGLLVPLTRELTLLDYIEGRGYPLILVSSPRLGSINHTLSALELAGKRGIEVKGVIYNCFQKCDPDILLDSRKIFAAFLENYGFSPTVVDLGAEEDYVDGGRELDCSQFFNIIVSKETK